MPFYTTNDHHFAKTGSAQKMGKALKKTHFCRWGDDSTWIQVDIHASADGSGFVLELDGKKEELAGKTITGVKYGQGIPVS
jgi:hypothetical protein